MSEPASLTQLGAEKYVRLTTFRRDGRAVPTVVWIVPDGDQLLVTTIDPTGKVKRLRHTSRVALVRCSAVGRVPDGAVETVARAELDWSEAGLRKLRRMIIAKYGLVARVYYRAEDLILALSRRKPKRQVMIRIMRSQGLPLTLLLSQTFYERKQVDRPLLP